MSATTVSFRWLDLLEKEFDKTFVDIDVVIGQVEDVEDGEWLHGVRAKLAGLSSCFVQLTHKAQTIFQTNAKLEAQILNLRHEFCQSEAQLLLYKEESKEMLTRLHSAQLEVHRRASSQEDASTYDKIQERMEHELETERQNRLAALVPAQEVVLLQRENENLRCQLLSMQGELTGAKLTARYLDKELAGRIQQLQLLSRDLSIEIPERVWHQLESEIHLHRHKTLVRICRDTAVQKQDIFSPNLAQPRLEESNESRFVVLSRMKDQNLGMSITGGRDHGVPILISELHPDMPAFECKQLYVGDAILSVNGMSLREMNHDDCVTLMSSLDGDIELEVLFVEPENDPEEEVASPLRYPLYDEDVASISSSLVAHNGHLSRASVDSIRGSRDDILASPRRFFDTSVELAEEVNVSCSDDIENELKESNSCELQNGLAEGDGTCISFPQSVDDDNSTNERLCIDEAVVCPNVEDKSELESIVNGDPCLENPELKGEAQNEKASSTTNEDHCTEATVIDKSLSPKAAIPIKEDLFNGDY